MAIERRFSSYTKEGNQEYSVEVVRIDDKFTCRVTGRFGNTEPIDRSFEAEGPDAEAKVQDFLFQLDEEVRAILERNVQLPSNPDPDQSVIQAGS